MDPRGDTPATRPVTATNVGPWSWSGYRPSRPSSSTVRRTPYQRRRPPGRVGRASPTTTIHPTGSCGPSSRGGTPDGETGRLTSTGRRVCDRDRPTLFHRVRTDSPKFGEEESFKRSNVLRITRIDTDGGGGPAEDLKREVEHRPDDGMDGTHGVLKCKPKIE